MSDAYECSLFTLSRHMSKTQKELITFLLVFLIIYLLFFFSYSAVVENTEKDKRMKILKGYRLCMSTRIALTQEVKKERKEMMATRRKRKRTKTKNRKEKAMQMAATKKAKER